MERNTKMELSILQQHWIKQEKQRPLSMYSSPADSNVSMIEKEFDQIITRSDVFSSTSVFQSDSTNSLFNIKVKEFCPIHKTEDDEKEEKRRSFKRFVYH